VTPEEQKTAEVCAHIMRVTRKSNRITQEDLARDLGISQSALSRMEHGSLIPSAHHWMAFCQITGIATDSIMTGIVDILKPVRLSSPDRVGSFKLPRVYRKDAGSTSRSMLPFVHFMVETMGKDKAKEWMKSRKLDLDYFYNLNHPINLNFCLDISQSLVESGELKPGHLDAITGLVAGEKTHGLLHHQYDACPDASTRLQTLIHHAAYYECNFDYKIEAFTPGYIDMSIKPKEHLAQWDYKDNNQLGDFLCQYKKSYFASFLGYKSPHQPSSKVIEEKSCHYHGADRCVYRIPLTA
jgi:transcriptional regulator with XRE-family HTH domain